MLAEEHYYYHYMIIADNDSLAHRPLALELAQRQSQYKDVRTYVDVNDIQ